MIANDNNEMLNGNFEFYIWYFSKVNDLFILLLAQRCPFAAFFILGVAY